MSEPVSNAEIEDVLSSIRRLVSEDPSPLLKRKRIAEGAKERFVLTPALRVPGQDGVANGEAEVTTEAEAEVTAPAEPENGQVAEHRQTLEQRIAELESALQQAPDEWEPDGSEVAESDRPVMPSFESVREEPDAVDEDQDEQAEELAQVTDEDAVTPEFNQQAEVEDSAPEPVDTAKPNQVDVEPEPEPEPEPEMVEKQDSDAESEAEPAEWQDAGAEEFAGIETEDAVLDEGVADAVASDDPADDADAPASEATDDTESLDMFAEDAVLDEAALRDMVSDLVRDELQGVLGERITRNVRRLVRREIQRALAVRELE